MKYSRFRPVSGSGIEKEENGSNNNNDGDEHEEGDVKDQGEGQECEQVVEGGEIDVEGEMQGGPGSEREDRGGPGSEEEKQGGPGSEEEERGGPGSLSLTPDIVKGRGDEEEEDSPRTPGGIVTISRLPDMLDHTPHSQGEPDR